MAERRIRTVSHRFSVLALVLLAAVLATPAQAEITHESDQGFAVSHRVRVSVDPDAAYAMVRRPSEWWDAAHSWTGSADNLYMDSQAGGCFCEMIRSEPDDLGERTLKGSVQHMRILYAEPGKLLRLSGGLGPLQSEAVTGTLSIAFEPVEGGTAIRFDYVVGGFTRFPIAKVAPAVDSVIGQQASRLAMALGPLLGGEDVASEPTPEG